MVDILNLALP